MSNEPVRSHWPMCAKIQRQEGENNRGKVQKRENSYGMVAAG